ncbi:hypothetical protein FWJ32_02075 [Calorimonas adulescens]|uniref:Uncharacterized protein n=1 Tax=Calorimonas adulescens TaxID=2606906 RepID=A0A5D8QF58_9THEO|nr:hypothetical protein FWJ32_02075 [Calorimonas adulescens]
MEKMLRYWFYLMLIPLYRILSRQRIDGVVATCSIDLVEVNNLCLQLIESFEKMGGRQDLYLKRGMDSFTM